MKGQSSEECQEKSEEQGKDNHLLRARSVNPEKIQMMTDQKHKNIGKLLTVVLNRPL